MSEKFIYDASTGESIRVPFTEEEVAEREQWAVEAAELEVTEEAKAEARGAAIAKLAKLGLTEVEIQALIGSV